MDIIKLKKAIEKIINYSWHDELDEYKIQLKENKSVKNHIFLTLVILDNFVTGCTLSAKDHIHRENQK